MSDKHVETIEALKILRTVYSECLSHFRSHTVLLDVNPHRDQELLTQAYRTQDRAQKVVLLARKRLLATGFEVPDKWLTVPAVGELHISFEGEAPHVRVLNCDGADVEALREICREIDAAIIRLQARPQVPPSKDDKHGRTTVAARMIDLVKDPSTHVWTARKFADKLMCGASTVVATAAWRQLATAREMAKLAQAEKAYCGDRSKRRSN